MYGRIEPLKRPRVVVRYRGRGEQECESMSSLGDYIDFITDGNAVLEAVNASIALQGQHIGPDLARYGCVTFRQQCETLRATGVEADEPLGDDCEAGFIDGLPPMIWELPECPGCGGPAEVK